MNNAYNTANNTNEVDNSNNTISYEAWIEGLSVIKRSEEIWGLTPSSLKRVQDFLKRGEESGYKVPGSILGIVLTAEIELRGKKDPNSYIKKRMLSSIVKNAR